MSDWKDAALAALGQYESLCTAADNLTEEAAAVSIKGPYGSERRLSGLARRRELQERAALYRRLARRVERALAVLTPAQRLVLEMLCLRPEKGNLGRLCELLCCEKSTVYRHRSEALRLFAWAYFGAGKWKVESWGTDSSLRSE